MMKIYEKLVRDKIPEIIISKGDTAITKVLADEEFSEYLAKKLSEEVQEFLADGSVEELVDIYEVILAILRHKNIALESFEELRQRKLLARGGFFKKILLSAVIEKEYSGVESNKG